MHRRAPLVLTLLLLWPASSPAQTTLLILDSEPGDPVGGGIRQTFTLADGQFDARQTAGAHVNVSFVAPGLEHWWYLDFAAPDDLPLTPGVYEGAVRYPFQEPGEPGMSVVGDGRGCNTVTGRFEVLEVRYGPGNTMASFAASFEQHCDGVTPALLGTILFNAGAPIPPEVVLTLGGCISCNAGDQFVATARVRNPGDRALAAEIKLGVRLPDGSGLSLLEGDHVVVSLPAGFDGSFPIVSVQLPGGLPVGAWQLEATLLEVTLGRTFDREVRVFEINP